MTKKYKLYSHLIQPDSLGYYTATFIGEGNGNIDSGSIVVSNKTGGSGNLTGYIHPEKKAVFTISKDKFIFISTDGTRMTLQNVLGKNQLSFIQSFLEFVLKYPIYDMEGDLYEGVDLGKKAYLVSYKYDNGKIGRATMTNSVKSVLKKTGEVIVSPLTAPITSTRDAVKDPTASNITKASLNDALAVATIAASFLVGPEAMAADAPVDVAVDAAVDALPKTAEELAALTEKQASEIFGKAMKEAGVTERAEFYNKMFFKLRTMEKDAGLSVVNPAKDSWQITQKAYKSFDNQNVYKWYRMGPKLSKTEKVLKAGAVKVGKYTIKPVVAVAKSSAVVGVIEGGKAIINKIF